MQTFDIFHFAHGEIGFHWWFHVIHQERAGCYKGLEYSILEAWIPHIQSPGISSHMDYVVLKCVIPIVGPLEFGKEHFILIGCKCNCSKSTVITVVLIGLPCAPTVRGAGLGVIFLSLPNVVKQIKF